MRFAPDRAYRPLRDMRPTNQLIDVRPVVPTDSHRPSLPAENAEAAFTARVQAAPPRPRLPDDLTGLVESATAEMSRRWRSGERPPAEEFLAQNPAIAGNRAAAVAVIFAEARLRMELLPAPEIGSLLDRFPQWREELQFLLPGEATRPAERARPGGWKVQTFGSMPEPGESFGEFQLIAELGRGVEGTVFLARQPGLSDRPLALKVSHRGGHEPYTLARLQHTHIVPLYAAGNDEERNLQWLAMPYLGGLPLNRATDYVRSCRPRREGRTLVDAIDSSGNPPPEGTGRGPWRSLFNASGYAEAVCRIGICLAEGLQYAHERGLVHLDLKPANVLLAADGTPMLLDFHLARPPISAGRAPAGVLGGTRDYMPPEQLAMMAAAAEGRPIPQAVGARADIYSLGIILYETLDTAPRFPGEPLAPLYRRHADVSRGLWAIVAKCLERDPERRYARAADLAEDLARHLASRPLRFAPDRNWGERYRKWRRRNPAALPLLILGTAVTAGTGVAAISHERQEADRMESALARARTALADGRGDIDRGDLAGAEATLRRGLDAASVPAAEGLRNELAVELSRARVAHLRREVGRTADALRFHFGGPLPPDVNETVRQVGTLWRARGEILAVTRPGASDDPVRTDLLDLGILYADLCARAGGPAATRTALNIIEEAVATFGPSDALMREETHYRNQRDGVAAVPTIPPARAGARSPSAAECYFVGRRLAAEGRYGEAEPWLRAALDERPGAFWPRFTLAVGLFRQGRAADALPELEVCVALKPESAECYYDRGLAHAAVGHTELAVADFTRALDRRPAFAAAHAQRGLSLLRAHRPRDAGSDFEAAIHQGEDTASNWVNLARARLEGGDAAGSRAALAEATKRDPHNADAERMQHGRLPAGR